MSIHNNIPHHNNQPIKQVDDEDEEVEEALSLCDLPINKPNQSPKQQVTGVQDQFDFGFGSSAALASQMCAADEVFFRGQILPFRNSVSSDSRCVSRSESMDHSYSGGSRSVINSRSSSIKSQYSSSSGSSTGYKPKIRNQFHSHPSPSPQIRSRSVRINNAGRRNPKSALWSFFQTGLVRTPPESIRLWGNNNINKSFGSRNSNSSSCSNVSNEKNNERKKKQRVFDINGALFSGCKCSVMNAVDIVVPSKIAVVVDEEKREKEEEGKQKRKQAVSRNRTFEWLKQLSLEDGS